jgi:dTMP kinase
MSKGLLISFEGGEAVGKTTQIELLHQRLTRLGYQVVLTREPGGTELAEKIRVLFKQHPMDPLSELFLVEASRAEHVRTVIQPALKRGAIVLCDRFQESSLVYQGMVRKLGLKLVENLNRLATDGLRSDLILWLDIPLKTLQSRLHSKVQSDRFDHAKMSFHEKILRYYRSLGRKRSWKKFDGTLAPEELHELIFAEVSKLLLKRIQRRPKR